MFNFKKMIVLIVIVTFVLVGGFTHTCSAAWVNFECKVLEAGFYLNNGYVKLENVNGFKFSKIFPSDRVNQCLAVALTALSTGQHVMATFNNSLTASGDCTQIYLIEKTSF